MWLTQAYNCGLARAANQDVDDDRHRQRKHRGIIVDDHPAIRVVLEADRERTVLRLANAKDVSDLGHPAGS
jgi:hypothetical protein